jgi:soluble lytic murein transglycosylase-like protein
MSTALIPLLIATSLFTTTIESALTHFEKEDFATAAALLDDAVALNANLFRINNLHYVRGRIAENELDWERARVEFSQVPNSSVLFRLSLWHRILSATRSGDMDEAGTLLGQLPANFPSDLRMKLADGVPDDFALRIYESVQTREALWRTALIRNDEPAMWRLLARGRRDDVGLNIARRLAGRGGTAEQRLRLARTFYTHRLFEQAGAVYATLLEDSSVSAEAHYELGRTFFQQARYAAAIRIYRRTIDRFPGTDQERDAEYQIASCHWRAEDFQAAAEVYLEIIAKEEDRNRYQSAVRNLIDVYRVLGRTNEAITWIDRAMDKRPSTSNRQVLLFTKAKMHYTSGRYGDAHELFSQLEQMRLRTAPNGTERSEVRHFKALSLDKLGRVAEARGVWRDLASEPFTYYGQRAAERLGADAGDAVLLNRTLSEAQRNPSPDLCKRASDKTATDTIRARRLSRTRSFRSANSPETDVVGELVFLRQWDQAFYWANRVSSRWKDIAMADLAYLASQFKPSMLFADRLRPVEDMQLFSLDADYTEEGHALLGMLYPSGFNASICKESAEAGVSPLWLQAIIWQESRYDPEARSGASARGLMQFIPETAARMARELGMGDIAMDELYDPKVSIRFGAHYWSQLMEELGHPALALAAYNGGIENVRRWQAKSGTDDVDMFVSDIGFTQTKDYVMKVFALYAKYAHLR